MSLWRSIGETLGLVEKVDRNAPGAVSRDVVLPPPSSGQNGQNAFQGPQGPIAPVATGGGADWHGPQNPMRPVAPQEVEGRILDFPDGYNLATQPRQYEQIGFHELRALAESLDVLRIVIETRKDQMAKLEWAIRPITMADGTSKASEKDPQIQEITDFLARPDGVHTWTTWLRMLLEDLFVIDAPAIYCDRTRGGKLLGLRQIDGALVKRIIDDWGQTPKPPVPAYQEILKGMPAVNYTTDDLIYRPRNPRAHKIFGLSPVEQVVITVNIALRRQLFQLEYYTSGNMPEALIGTPKEWTSQQVAIFQKDFDARLSGNSAARRRANFIPGDVAKNVVLLKEPELTGQMDEWLARVVCYCFSISPQPFVSMMNRATAESAHDAAIEEGLQPLQKWVKDLVDEVILRFWQRSDIEFAWQDDREVDAQLQSDVLTAYVKSGVQTINEVRDVLGLKPVPGGDIPRVMTATGYVLIEANDQAPEPAEAAPGEPAQADAAEPGAKTKTKEPKPEPESTKEAPATKHASAAFRKTYWPTTSEVAARRHDASHASRP